MDVPALALAGSRASTLPTHVLFSTTRCKPQSVKHHGASCEYSLPRARYSDNYVVGCTNTLSVRMIDHAQNNIQELKDAITPQYPATKTHDPAKTKMATSMTSSPDLPVLCSLLRDSQHLSIQHESKNFLRNL